MSSSSTSWRAATGGPSTTDVFGPRAKCDQVVYEAVAKACEIIVQSRCPAGSTRTAPSSSSRFNLHMPEYPDVRKVLYPFKRSLHVPLRLDVYYQSDGDNDGTTQKQLLERWCLAYAPCHAAFFQEECSSLDPLVQLRHVCKKLVLWLRTLYCTSQLLPCRKSPRIQFSIHLSSDETQQDVLELQRNLNFEQQSHSSVHTPYGRLELLVLYAPRHAVSHLFPKQATARWTTPSGSKSASRPIPTSSSQEKAMWNSPSQQRDGVEPQSAPAHISIIPNYTSSPNAMQQQRQQMMMAATTTRSKSYKSPVMEQRKQQHARPVVLRTQSAVSDRDVTYEHHPPQEQRNSGEGRMEQKRVLSGLSLALMNAEEEQQQQQPQLNHQHSSPPSPRVVEQRRAALHHAPPVLATERSSSSSSPPHPGDYGYAYNNHIPWGHLGKVGAAATPPRTELYTTTTTSPVLGSTPPQPMFCVGKTPPPVPLAAAGINTTTTTSPLLIPPISSSNKKTSSTTDDTTITPPFAALPTTLGETPKAPNVKLHYNQAPHPIDNNAAAASMSAQQQPPISSLDLLHSSPFQQQQQQQNSILSSLSGTEHFQQQSLLLPNSDIMLKSGTAWMGYSSAGSVMERTITNVVHDEDAMPFAVDTPTTTMAVDAAATQDNPATTTTSMEGSATRAATTMDLGASAALARKCATASRLKLFDHDEKHSKEDDTANNNTNAVDSLARQLEGFRSFGASLTSAAVATPSNPDNTDANSTSTPISLKT